MVDVTHNNYAKHKPQLIKSIQTADFIAFDFEFSALCIDASTKSSDFDSHQQRYLKLARTVRNSHAFQLGLTTFKFDKDHQQFVARPYNIYLFPNSQNHVETPEGNSSA